MSDNRQMDIHEVAELLGLSWQTIRYYQIHKNPIPHYKRDGNVFRPEDGMVETVERYMKGARVIFLRPEVEKWKKEKGL